MHNLQICPYRIMSIVFSKSGRRKIIAQCRVGREMFCPHAGWALKNFKFKISFSSAPHHKASSKDPPLYYLWSSLSLAHPSLDRMSFPAEYLWDCWGKAVWDSYLQNLPNLLPLQLLLDLQLLQLSKPASSQQNTHFLQELLVSQTTSSW